MQDSNLPLPPSDASATSIFLAGEAFHYIDGAFVQLSDDAEVASDATIYHVENGEWVKDPSTGTSASGQESQDGQAPAEQDAPAVEAQPPVQQDAPAAEAAPAAQEQASGEEVVVSVKETEDGRGLVVDYVTSSSDAAQGQAASPASATQALDEKVEAPYQAIHDQMSSESLGSGEVDAKPMEEASPSNQEPVAPEAPAAPAEQAPVNIDSAPAKSEEEQYLDKVRLSGTEVQKRMLAAAETFNQHLTPRTPIEPAVGANRQYEFLNHLLWILNKEYDEFRLGWTVLLLYFATYHGNNNSPSKHSALSEFSTNRFLFAWTKGEDRCAAYKNLVTLLRATRHAGTRQHDIKTISLDKLGSQDVITEKMLANLRTFYKV